MSPHIQALIDHYQFERLPIEGTFFKNTYRSAQQSPAGGPIATAMMGLYVHEPESLSRFHRLTHDEVWHFYGGDPVELHLLFADGSAERILLGPDPLQGHHLQYLVPAEVWQGACLTASGTYALFGCTMAPGFTGDCFEAGLAERLVEQYPEQREIIGKLGVQGQETQMPEGFEG
ncbi:MAG: cupin domain-containing protein [Bacteroidota bacterium]